MFVSESYVVARQKFQNFSTRNFRFKSFVLVTPVEREWLSDSIRKKKSQGIFFWVQLESGTPIKTVAMVILFQLCKYRTHDHIQKLVSKGQMDNRLGSVSLILHRIDSLKKPAFCYQKKNEVLVRSLLHSTKKKK